MVGQPGAIIQNRVYDAFDGAQPNIASFNSAAYSPTDACGFQPELWCRWWTRPSVAKAVPAADIR